MYETKSRQWPGYILFSFIFPPSRGAFSLSRFFSAHSRHSFPLVCAFFYLVCLSPSPSLSPCHPPSPPPLSLPLSLRLYPCDDGRIIQSRLFTDFPSKETHRLRAERFLFLGASAVALTFRIETGLISYSFLPTPVFSARSAFFPMYICIYCNWYIDISH